MSKCRDPFPTIDSPRFVYRVSRSRDALELVPWDAFPEDAQLDGRWDDWYPRQYAYRVLYTCSSVEGAYRETLQDFRPSLALRQELMTIAREEDEDDPTSRLGIVPGSWLARTISTIEVRSPRHCVDVCNSRSLDLLIVETQVRDISDLLGAARATTRSVSRFIYNHPDDYVGIAAPSVVGAESSNFSFFEDGHDTNRFRANLTVVDSRQVAPPDEILFDVVNSLGLRFERIPLEALEPATEKFEEPTEREQ